MYLAALKKYTVFFVVTSLLVFVNSCKSSGTGPEDNVPAGRRDYVWTVDTLNPPGQLYSEMWGLSENDIYMVGSGVVIGGYVMHYDGKNWKSATKYTNGFSDPNCIFGFAKNDIWMAGQQGNIFHHNGNIWEQNYIYAPPESDLVSILDMYGDSPDDIYAVGQIDSVKDGRRFSNGLILHYNGVKWERVYVESENIIFAKIKRGKAESGNYYITANDGYWADTAKIVEFDGKSIKVIYSGDATRETDTYARNVGDKMLFSIGTSLQTYRNGKFEKLTDINLPDFNMQFWGRSPKDVFLSTRGGIAHYNGTDVKYLIKCDEKIGFSDAVIFDSTIVFCGNDFKNRRTYIFKGILETKK